MNFIEEDARGRGRYTRAKRRVRKSWAVAKQAQRSSKRELLCLGWALLAITIIGIPFARQHLKLMELSLQADGAVADAFR